MSIFASRTRKILEMSFDDERHPDGSCHTVTIQKLSGRQIEKAREAATFAQIASAMEIKKQAGGESDFQRELASAAASPQAVEILAQQANDPTNGLDVDTLLEKGIVEWTYGEVNVGNMNDLDEESRLFLAREIALLSLPRTKEARGNASRPSTAA